MRVRTEALFSLFIVVLATGALLGTQGWIFRTAFYPRVIGVPLLVLAAIEFILSLRGREAPREEQAMDVALSEGVDPHVALRRTIRIFAWIFGFFAALVVLGFQLAIPLFVLAYLKGEARERWGTSLILVVAAWLLFDGLFVRLLHLPFPSGLLFRILE